MASFLVCYGIGEGQPELVADRVVEALEARGHDASSVDASVFPANVVLDGFDAIVVGTAGRGVPPGPDVRRVVETNHAALGDCPTAHFQVSPATVGADDRRSHAARSVERFLTATGWDPDRIAVFGGALRFAKYGFLDRLEVERLAADASDEADASGDYEYDDWGIVEDFAADLATFVEGRRGRPGPGDEETADDE